MTPITDSVVAQHCGNNDAWSQRYGANFDPLQKWNPCIDAKKCGRVNYVCKLLYNTKIL